MRDYRVVFCDEDELPIGQDWTFVRRDGQVCFFVKEKVTAETLADAWRAFREVAPELVA